MSDGQSAMSVPGLLGNANPVGNPIIGTVTVESDREVLELRAKVRRLEYDAWLREWIATYGVRS